MAFFDQLGKQISNAGKTVAQQTKNFADGTLLQNSISEKQKSTQQLYAALGQIYYEAHKDDPTAKGYATISQITTLLAEINQCREQLSRLRGNNICPTCGAEVPGNAQFCRGCGTKMEVLTPAPPAPAHNTCPNCGAAVPGDSQFCRSCGTRVEFAAPASPAPARRVCPQCGSEVDPDSLFCTLCGSKL